jgi:hypothetical protein
MREESEVGNSRRRVHLGDPRSSRGARGTAPAHIAWPVELSGASGQGLQEAAPITVTLAR